MIRSVLKRGLRTLLGHEEPAAATPRSYPFKYSPSEERQKEEVPTVDAAPAQDSSPVPAAVLDSLVSEAEAEACAEPPAVLAEAAKRLQEAPSEPAAEADASADDDSPFVSMETIQELFDDMVRPALQADGGDITLIKIERRDVYVRLIGACATCPSSIMTMKLGVEALLREEFPQMEQLIQVD